MEVELQNLLHCVHHISNLNTVTIFQFWPPTLRRNWEFNIEKNVCLPVFSDGQEHWWDISKAFQPHSWHLVSRKLTWKRGLPMERSIFQNDFFANLSSDSDSSQKTVDETAFLFLIFFEEDGQISKKLDVWG